MNYPTRIYYIDEQVAISSDSVGKIRSDYHSQAVYSCSDFFTIALSFNASSAFIFACFASLRAEP